MDSDAVLLAAARAGDRDALETLLSRYQGTVYRFGMRMCGDPEDAKDVLQETLLAMARGVREFRGAASLSTWLYTIARSVCIKKRRRKSATASAVPLDASESAALADPAADPERATEMRRIESALAHAIADLAPMYREVLVLRDLEGLPAVQVAAVLGVSVDTVKSRLHRARVSVRGALAPFIDGGTPEPARRDRACPDVLRLFSRHLEGDISATVCADMERHIAVCPACRRTCASLQRTLQLCRAAPAAPVPAEVQASVRRCLRDALGATS